MTLVVYKRTKWKMHLLQLFCIFVILNGRTTQSELRIEIRTPSGLAELEEAAIQLLTTCYANQTKTIALVGDYSSSFMKRLSSHKSFALVQINDRIRSENNINLLGEIDIRRKHKVDILVAMVPWYFRFSNVLWGFWFSLYDNPMALTLLLVWSPEHKDSGCDGKYETVPFLYYSNTKNHLNTILMCHHRKNEVMIYTSNPFKDQAPEPWQSVPFGYKVWGMTFFYFARKYRVNEDMCKNLAFDKTRDLNGRTIKLSWNVAVYIHENEIKPIWWSNRGIRLSQQSTFAIIKGFVTYVNASMTIKSVRGGETVKWDRYVVSLAAFRGLQITNVFYTYPRARVTTFLVTQFRGNKSQLRKILGVIDEYSWIGMLFFYLITLTFFKYFLRQPLLVGILNLCRLTCNCGLTTLPRNVASQIYLFCVLSLVVIMQGIFTGNLASLLTHDFPVRQVDSIEDVIDLNYTVYCEGIDFILFADPRFKGQLIRIKDREHCIEEVKRDANGACVIYTPEAKYLASKSHLYRSTESIDVEWFCNVVPWRWSLLDRFDAYYGILSDTRAAVPLETMVDEKRMHELEDVEVELKPEIMKLGDLCFAFVLLGIGLVCATITFIGEKTVYWYYHRVKTTRVIVLKR